MFNFHKDRQGTRGAPTKKAKKIKGIAAIICFHILLPIYIHYDTLSASIVKSVPKLAKSESGQMVSEKVKLTYYDVYLSQAM